MTSRVQEIAHVNLPARVPACACSQGTVWFSEAVPSRKAQSVP